MNNFQKFLFLGVIIVLTALAGQGERRVSPASVASIYGRPGMVRSLIPTLVLSAPLPPIATPQSFESQEISSTSAVSIELASSAIRILNDGAGEGASRSSSSVAGPAKTTQATLRGGQLAHASPIFSADRTAYAFDTPENFSPSGLYPRRDAPVPDTRARAALVVDVLSRQTFFGMNQEMRWPLASLTKLMTAVLVMKNFDLNYAITIGTPEVVDDSSDKIFKTGDRYTVKDLLRVMLVASSNESAEAFATAYGHANFVALMNNEAVALDLHDTHFDDPSGLSVADQSTASDIAKLASLIYTHYPQIFAITEARRVVITELDSGRTHLVTSTNSFAGKPDFLGGKTGYTDEANGNLVSLFLYKKRPIVIVVMGTDDRFGDTERLREWFESTYR